MFHSKTAIASHTFRHIFDYNQSFNVYERQNNLLCSRLLRSKDVLAICKMSPTEDLHIDANVPRLSSRRKQHTCQFVYKGSQVLQLIPSILCPALFLIITTDILEAVKLTFSMSLVSVLSCAKATYDTEGRSTITVLM